MEGHYDKLEGHYERAKEKLYDDDYGLCYICDHWFGDYSWKYCDNCGQLICLECDKKDPTHNGCCVSDSDYGSGQDCVITD